MKRTGLLVAALALIGLAGCIPVSLQPGYTAADLVFDQALVGKWHSQGEESWLEFQKAGDKSYQLVLFEDSVTSRFEAHLFRAGQGLFLDLYPSDVNIEGSEIYRMHILAVHSFCRVDMVGPKLIIAGLDPDWLGTYVKEHPGEIEGTETEDTYVFTAPTEKLRAFLAAHWGTEGAFFNSDTLERMSN